MQELFRNLARMGRRVCVDKQIDFKLLSVEGIFWQRIVAFVALALYMSGFKRQDLQDTNHAMQV